MSVEGELARLLRPTREVPALDDDHAALLAALELGATGGKRFRPWLVTAVHETLGGGQPDRVVDTVAAAVELLHTAFVVHDDVIDHDLTRRGRPSVLGWFADRGEPGDQDEQLARAGAILTGDLALAAAVRALATCGADPETTGRLLDLLHGTLHASAAGELADVRLSRTHGTCSLDEALAVTEHKTADYSFVLPMQAGGLLAGADEGLVQALGALGRHLGIAFQLHDDLLGVFGDPERTGKSALGDLREGKRTPLVVHAAGTPAWPTLARHLGNAHLDEVGAAEARTALEESGSRRFVEELAEEHLADARALAREVDLHLRLVDPLIEALGHAWGTARVGAA